MSQLKIIGGIGKTGTQSLRKALGILGYRVQHYPVVWDLSADGWVDSPVFAGDRLEKLALTYDMKIIWLDRDLGSWLDSWEAHVKTRSAPTPQQLILREAVFGSQSFDENLWARAYMRHRKRCQNLGCLEFSVREGWRRLCQFLDVPVPDVPFPWENRRPL